MENLVVTTRTKENHGIREEERFLVVISSFLSAILENQSLLVWVEKRGTHFVSHWKNDVEQLICIKLALAVLLGPMRPSGLC